MDIVSPSAEPTAMPGSSDSDAAQHCAALRELIDMGMALARAVQARALAQIEAPGEAGAAAAADGAAAFDRVARCVRRSILLARAVTEPAGPRAADEDAAKRRVTRKEIFRRVDDAIMREAPDEQAESLRAELLERLDAPDLDDEIRCRPIDSVIRNICADLHLVEEYEKRIWRRRTPADLSAIAAVAASPSAPTAQDAAAGGGMGLLCSARFRGKQALTP